MGLDQVSAPQRAEVRFVAHLRSLYERGDRAALSALRRSLGKGIGESAEAHRYVVPWLPAEAPDWRAELWYLVAALYATYPDGPVAQAGDGNRARNFGHTAAAVRASRASQQAAVDRRFTALLASHADDVVVHLRHFVGMCRDARAAIDWASLLVDLQSWRKDGAPAQRRWARAYWSAQAAEPVAVSDSNTSQAGDTNHVA